VRKLWGNLNATVATRWNWTLFVQRLWPVLQNEWTESTTDQAKAKTGKYHKLPLSFFLVLQFSFVSHPLCAASTHCHKLINKFQYCIPGNLLEHQSPHTFLSPKAIKASVKVLKCHNNSRNIPAHSSAQTYKYICIYIVYMDMHMHLYLIIIFLTSWRLDCSRVNALADNNQGASSLSLNALKT